MDNSEMMERIGDSNKYRLIKGIAWSLSPTNHGVCIKIESGFEFDISVPFIFRWLVSPHDPKILMPAALHDKMIQQDMNRITCSTEFARAARYKGCSKLMCSILFLSTLVYSVFPNKLI